MRYIKTKTQKIFLVLILLLIYPQSFYAADIFSQYNISRDIYTEYKVYLSNRYADKIDKISITKKEKIVKKIDIILDDQNDKNTDQKTALLALKDILLEEPSMDLEEEISQEKQAVLKKLQSDIYNNFTKVVLKENNIFLEDGIWYTYVFTKYKNFGEGIIPSQGDLDYAGISQEESLLLLSYNSKDVSFVVDYEKVKLIDDSIIDGIANKNNFLLEVADDKKHIHTETDAAFADLKNDTIKIIEKYSTKQEKTEAIYAYVLKHAQYTENVDFEDKKIFSGIETYKNKDGVCGGYTKLFLYMLSFAGIDEVEVIRGYVINASDFPYAGHAWVQIGDVYYDPTFDDPIGSRVARTYGEYEYFGLPKDLFYTNRYDYEALPEYIKELSLEDRENIIEENRRKLLEKYKLSKYNILKAYF